MLLRPAMIAIPSPFALSLSLPFSSGRLWPICSRLTDWTWIHATIWIFKHTNRIHRKRPQFGWKSKTLHHSLYRNTLWDGNGIYHANVMFYSRSLNFWIQPTQKVLRSIVKMFKEKLKYTWIWTKKLEVRLIKWKSTLNLASATLKKGSFESWRVAFPFIEEPNRWNKILNHTGIVVSPSFYSSFRIWILNLVENTYITYQLDLTW